MNRRSITLGAILVLLLIGWLVYAVFFTAAEARVEVHQRPHPSASHPSAEVAFAFHAPLKLTELVVERLDEATQRERGMIIETSEGPGPIWRMVPEEGRDASEPTKGIFFGKRRDVSLRRLSMVHDVRPIILEPGIRYRITVKAQSGLIAQAEFVAEPNKNAQP